MAKQSSVAERPNNTVATRADMAKARIAEAIKSMTRADQTAEELALTILEATSIDDILGSTVVHLQDMVGVPFTILSAVLTASDYADGLGAYTVMEVEFQDGSRGVVTTGATNVVAQVIAMHSGNHFPQWVQCKSDTTNSGYTVLKLERGVGDRPTQAQLQDF